MIYEVWLVDGNWKELQWQTTNIIEADTLFNYGRAVAKQFNIQCVLSSRDVNYDTIKQLRLGDY